MFREKFNFFVMGANGGAKGFAFFPHTLSYRVFGGDVRRVHVDETAYDVASSKLKECNSNVLLAAEAFDSLSAESISEF